MKLAPLLLVTTTVGTIGTLSYYGDGWGISKYLSMHDAQPSSQAKVEALYYTDGLPEWADGAAWLASLPDIDQEAVLKPFNGSFVCGTVEGGRRLVVNADLTMFWSFPSLEHCTALLDRIRDSYTTRSRRDAEALNRDLKISAIKDVKVYDVSRYPPNVWKALKFVMIYKGMPPTEREFWYRTLLWQLEMTSQLTPSILSRRTAHTPATVFIPKTK